MTNANQQQIENITKQYGQQAGDAYADSVKNNEPVVNKSSETPQISGKQEGSAANNGESKSTLEPQNQSYSYDANNKWGVDVNSPEFKDYVQYQNKKHPNMNPDYYASKGLPLNAADLGNKYISDYAAHSDLMKANNNSWTLNDRNATNIWDLSGEQSKELKSALEKQTKEALNKEQKLAKDRSQNKWHGSDYYKDRNGNTFKANSWLEYMGNLHNEWKGISEFDGKGIYTFKDANGNTYNRLCRNMNDFKKAFNEGNMVTPDTIVNNTVTPTGETIKQDNNNEYLFKTDEVWTDDNGDNFPVYIYNGRKVLYSPGQKVGNKWFPSTIRDLETWDKAMKLAGDSATYPTSALSRYELAQALVEGQNKIIDEINNNPDRIVNETEEIVKMAKDVLNGKYENIHGLKEDKTESGDTIIFKFDPTKVFGENEELYGKHTGIPMFDESNDYTVTIVKSNDEGDTPILEINRGDERYSSIVSNIPNEYSIPLIEDDILNTLKSYTVNDCNKQIEDKKSIIKEFEDQYGTQIEAERLMYDSEIDSFPLDNYLNELLNIGETDLAEQIRKGADPNTSDEEKAEIENNLYNEAVKLRNIPQTKDENGNVILDPVYTTKLNALKSYFNFVIGDMNKGKAEDFASNIYGAQTNKIGKIFSNLINPRSLEAQIFDRAVDGSVMCNMILGNTEDVYKAGSFYESKANNVSWFDKVGTIIGLFSDPNFDISRAYAASRNATEEIGLLDKIIDKCVNYKSDINTGIGGLYIMAGIAATACPALGMNVASSLFGTGANYLLRFGDPFIKATEVDILLDSLRNKYGFSLEDGTPTNTNINQSELLGHESSDDRNLDWEYASDVSEENAEQFQHELTPEEMSALIKHDTLFDYNGNDK
ncbi:MAG: hypothetical protein HUJ56_05025 [Erysipelotrichaceae bacterium]|nr:hypothetical protein [Erysipelotrichaceae bacterium]